MAAIRICFVGSSRYSRSLDATTAKKFDALAAVADVTVVGFSADMVPHQFTSQARFLLMPALPGWLVRIAEMMFIGSTLLVWCVMRHGVEVIIAQSPLEGVVGAWGKTMARVLGRRCALVVESHGDFEEAPFLYRAVPLRKLARLAIRWASNYALRHSDALRAVSSATLVQLRAKAPGQPCVQFPAWTDIDLFLEQPLGERRSEVLFAGTLVPLKGVDILMHAFAQVARRHPTASLIIAGRAMDPDYSAKLRTLRDSLDLSSRVSFVDWMPQRELARLMSRVAVVVLPSFSEGFGRVLLEAMATGTPVIGSRVGGIVDLIADGVNGFTVPRADSAALAGRIGWILDRPDDAKKLGWEGRRRARTLFSVDRYASEYAALFELARRVSRETRDRNCHGAEPGAHAK